MEVKGRRGSAVSNKARTAFKSAQGSYRSGARLRDYGSRPACAARAGRADPSYEARRAKEEAWVKEDGRGLLGGKLALSWG
jgi:hypothetical protein